MASRDSWRAARPAGPSSTARPSCGRTGASAFRSRSRTRPARSISTLAPFALLSGLLAAAGEKQEAAYLLACRIVAHRGTPAPSCPEPPSAAPERTALFAAPEEAAQLPGFGDRLYAAISCCLTVLSGASAIDPAVAPRLALMALPGATASIVDGWLASRASLMEMAPEMSGFESLPDAAYLAVSALSDFTVSAVATTPEGARARADLVVRLTGAPNHPYDIVAFRTPAVASVRQP